MRAERIGLTARAVDTLASGADLSFVRAGQVVCSSTQQTDFVRVLVAGIVKLVVRLPGDTVVTVRWLAPGEIFCLPPPNAVAPFRVEAIPHGRVIVALVSRGRVADAIGALPADRITKLLSASWRATTRWCFFKSTLLAMPLVQRVVYELCVLARTFGRPHEYGTIIGVPVLHSDIADLVSASRANVSRHMGRLRRAGLVLREGRHTVVSAALIEAHRYGTVFTLGRRSRDRDAGAKEDA